MYILFQTKNIVKICKKANKLDLCFSCTYDPKILNLAQDISKQFIIVG